MINQDIKTVMKKSIDYAGEKGVSGCDVIVSWRLTKYESSRRKD